MRSQGTRWTVVAVVWVALGAAAALVFHSQQQIVSAAARLRTADLQARATTDAIVELRAAQQAYVATGQGVAVWVPRVAAARDAVDTTLAALRQSVTSPAAQGALNEAATTLAEFTGIDKRARDYLRSGQTLMAGDVIFTEGGEAAAGASQQIEAARQAEHEAFDAFEASLRSQEAFTLAAAASLAGIVALLLAPPVVARPVVDTVRDAYRALAASEDGIVSHARPIAAAPPPAPPPASPATRTAPVLKAAADLATDFGRVRDSDELERLLVRAAEILDASGLIVWVGGSAGEDLRPVLVHGYTPQAVARMASVPRSADNAAGAAYRTGRLQIVLSRPGGLNGAIVAPILAADGCIGALSAEIRGGGEGSEGIQALVAIIAAHLANIVSVAPNEAAERIVG